jgi:hypothetical protein
MNKVDLGQMITLGANVGVIAGILFLAIEVRQNTETQRLSAAQQVLGLSYSNTIALAADPTASEILVEALAGQELTPVEQNRMGLILQAILTQHWQVYYQYKNGFLDQAVFDAFERRLPAALADPFMVDWWESNRSRFAEDFQDYVESVIGPHAVD